MEKINPQDIVQNVSKEEYPEDSDYRRKLRSEYEPRSEMNNDYIQDLNIKKYIGLKNFDIVILSGGGAKHRILVEDLKENLSNLLTIDSYDISIDAKEAFLMAVMGFSCYKNIPNNMPSVTGAKKYASYGSMYE